MPLVCRSLFLFGGSSSSALLARRAAAPLLAARGGRLLAHCCTPGASRRSARCSEQRRCERTRGSQQPAQEAEAEASGELLLLSCSSTPLLLPLRLPCC